MNVLVLMLVCQRVPGSTSLENINIYRYPLQQTNDGKSQLPCDFEDFKLFISSFLHGITLNSLPLWFRKSDVPFFTGSTHLEQTTKTHPTWGKTASTNPSPWALRPAQNLLKHIESSDLLNKFTIIIIHQIIKVMNILILTDFDKWFNMLHLKIKKKLAEALDSKKLCSLALDSRVCTWTKKGWNRNWRFNGWWLATPGVGKDRSK